MPGSDCFTVCLHPLHLLICQDCFTVLTVSQSQSSAHILISGLGSNTYLYLYLDLQIFVFENAQDEIFVFVFGWHIWAYLTNIVSNTLFKLDVA